jgi:hypothetical protein
MTAVTQRGVPGGAMPDGYGWDGMLPESCPACDVPWGALPDEHSAVMDPRTFRMECQGTVSRARYAQLESSRSVR